MGISAGWRDVYEYTLPFQYIDVSDLQPGHYWMQLRGGPGQPAPRVERDQRRRVPPRKVHGRARVHRQATVNPFQVSGVKESTSNDHAVPGLVLQHGRRPIGAVQYKITEQPEHGTVKPVTGTAGLQRLVLRPGSIYTKTGSYNGADDFKYAARQGTQPVPAATPPAQR